MKIRKVVVIGASNKTDRYSYQAVKLLAEMGYQPIPVHPKLKEILGINVCPSMRHLAKQSFASDVALTKVANATNVASCFKDNADFCSKSIESIVETEIDTIAVYVNPEISSGLIEQIIQVKPRRVIFNPNTENPELASKLAAAGIETIEACTLVMLRTGQF